MPDTSPIPPAASVSSIRESLTRIALEIIIGFVGVYAAFALSAYKDHRDDIERRHQIKRALIREISGISSHEAKQMEGYAMFLARFDSTVAAGHPRPHPFTEAVDLGNHVWDAAKQAGGLQLLDVPTFLALSDFYNEESEMYAQYAQLRDISMREILPRWTDGPDAFLGARTHAPLPFLEVYRWGLSRMQGFSHQLAVRGDTLIQQLAADTI